MNIPTVQHLEDIQALDSGENPLVLLFVLDGCPFCRAFRPQFETYMQENPFTYTYALYTSVDGDDALSEAYTIKSFPSILVLQHNKVLQRIEGRIDEGLDVGDLEELG